MSGRFACMRGMCCVDYSVLQHNACAARRQIFVEVLLVGIYLHVAWLHQILIASPICVQFRKIDCITSFRMECMRDASGEISLM